MFVGAKMLLADLYKVPVGASLGVIAILLGTSIAASLLWPKVAEAHDPVGYDPVKRDNHDINNLRLEE